MKKVEGEKESESKRVRGSGNIWREYRQAGRCEDDKSRFCLFRMSIYKSITIYRRGDELKYIDIDLFYVHSRTCLYNLYLYICYVILVLCGCPLYLCNLSRIFSKYIYIYIYIYIYPYHLIRLRFYLYISLFSSLFYNTLSAPALAN